MLNVDLMVEIIKGKHSFKYIKDSDILHACNRVKAMKNIDNAIEEAMKDLENTNSFRTPKQEKKSLAGLLDFTNHWR